MVCMVEGGTLHVHRGEHFRFKKILISAVLTICIGARRRWEVLIRSTPNFPEKCTFFQIHVKSKHFVKYLMVKIALEKLDF